jgi:large subunit ribosomal protein L7/L12
MKVLKKILGSLVVAASMAVVSSTAFAAPKGEAEVKAAIENTISGIETAQAAVKSGDLSTASQDILKAAQDSKEFRFEITERQRQKATDTLKAARRSIEKGEIEAGEAGLEAALKSFKEMKAKYDLTH